MPTREHFSQTFVVAREATESSEPTEAAFDHPAARQQDETLAAILSTGLLRIRARTWGNDASRCTLEADHLHNLPSMMVNYKPALLIYYWHVERPCFIDRSAPEDITAFEPLWLELAKYVTADTSRSIAG